MPTSSLFNINTVVSLIGNLAPKRVLDVGCGFGKYGVLAREYLDVAAGRLGPSEWQVKLVGIEGFANYRNPIHDFAYTEVHYGDALDLLPTLGEFDLVLILDVIEHLDKPRAQQLVRDALARSPAVVVSTPIDFFEQGAEFGNPYEIHRSPWGRGDFDPGVAVRTIRAVACDVFVASRGPLPPNAFVLTDPADQVYLRSRQKLGKLGLPLSLMLKWMNRLLS
jgi:2-polyprenyl-3-methyl-5-hydroxy-6-metoxy-1,4-benzoquinol methylase